MTQVNVNNKREEWLKVLGKGMITLPKKWRDEMGIANGDVVKARKEGNKVVIEIVPAKQSVPYRVYSAAEIDAFLADDAIPAELAQALEAKLGSSPVYEKDPC